MKSPSLRWQVVALVLASAGAAQAIGFGALLLFPPPEAPRMTVAAAARALTAPAGPTEAAGLRLELADRPPEATVGGLSGLIRAALAAELATSSERVRVRLLDSRSDSETASAPVQVLSAERVRTRFVVRRGPGDVFVARMSPQLLLRSVPLPPFEASLRRADGRWTTAGPRRPLLSPWRIRVLGAFLLSTALLAPLAWWSARRLTRPVRVFAEAAERLGLNPQAPALAVEGPAEVRTAALSMNRMQDRLRRYLAERTAMVAAIAHDLRTPLTGLRLRAETAPPVERDRMAADIARMEAMIAQVLGFVRGEQVQETRERLDLAALAADCVAEAAERGADAVLRATEPVTVLGEPLKLRRAVANLVENAVLYGGSAEAAVRREGDTAVLTVSDRGPGLRSTDLERVLEPFARVEESRSRVTGGVGLGLASAGAAARAHGGELRLENREGGGLRARLSLPAAPEAISAVRPS